MSKSRVPFQEGFSLVGFMGQWGTKADRGAALFKPMLPGFLRANVQTAPMPGRLLKKPKAGNQEKKIRAERVS